MFLNKNFYNQYLKLQKNNNYWGIQILNTVVAIAEKSKAPGLNKEAIVNGYWSYRVNDEIRIITIEQNGEIVVIYVGHHDDAYRFCNTTKPTFTNGKYIGSLFNDTSDKEICNNTYDFLKEHGIDQYTINKLNECKDDDEVRKAIKYYSPELRELIISKGKIDECIQGYSSDILVINEDSDLEKALSLKLPDWCIFLHPNQIYVKDYSFNENIMVKGGPGTGKTVAMVWRYVNLYRNSAEKKPCFLCRSATTGKIIKDMIKLIDKDIEPIILEFPINLTHQQMTKFLCQFSHIVIDECQDLSNYAVDMLVSKISIEEKILPNFSISLDLNQSILNVGNRKLFRRIEKIFKVVQLNYCYRCTQQILEIANKKLLENDYNGTVLVDETTINMDYPLYGEDVKTIELKDDSAIEREITNFINVNHLSIVDDQWCIIFCGFFNDKIFYELEEKYPNHIFDSEQVKGNEYFIGIVFHYWKNEQPNNQTDLKKAKFEPYVSITRFRNHCWYFRVNKEYNNERNILKEVRFEPEDLDSIEYVCDCCGMSFKGLPWRKQQYFSKGVQVEKKYCRLCWKVYTSSNNKEYYNKMQKRKDKYKNSTKKKSSKKNH